MPTGTVKYVERDRGFGFISRDDKKPKVFVHVTAVLEAGFTDLEKGQRWAFELAEDRGKQIAINLVPI